jgi:hypothetical protein
MEIIEYMFGYQTCTIALLQYLVGSTNSKHISHQEMNGTYYLYQYWLYVQKNA